MGLVIFDLDGTLLDTLEDLRVALCGVLADEGRRGVTSDEARRMVGAGARNLLALAWAATGEPATAERIDALYPRFLARYNAGLLVHTRPFPGAVEALDELGRDHLLSVATNKPLAPTRRILDGLGLSGRFHAIVGGDSLPVKKPDGRVIAAARGGFDGPAVLVGDSATDVKTARNAGIPMILARWGYPGPDGAPPLADREISAFEELPAAVGDLLAG